MKTIRILPKPPITITKMCGGKKKGSCNTWAGATTLQTNIKIAA